MATTTNFGWETPDDTDLVKDGALAMRTLGNSIDTSFVDLKGGTTGQVLSKASNTDLDFSWVAQDDSNAIQNAIIDAKGDLIVGTAADTPARLAVGTNGHVLTADSTTASGVKWAAAAGGGKVLQVVSGTTTTGATVTSNTTYLDTNLTATITPSATSSKILVMTSQGLFKEAQTNSAINYRLLRGSTTIVDIVNAGILFQDTALRLGVLQSLVYLDSPNTTSATTYKTQFKNYLSGGTAVAQPDSQPGNIILMEIGA
jgi:hypothetical protein